MPYNSREDLPNQVKQPLKNLPHAQDIYKEAFNSAIEQYNDENRAHATAWSAVKEKYYKDQDGQWRKKS